MDVTEYDEMRKRSELAEKYAASLEETKKEISELHKQLQAKDKERIEELENSTKSVTYIKKETREEIALVKRDKLQIINRLIEMARHAGAAANQGGRFGGHSYSDYRGHLEGQFAVEGFVEALFDKTQMVSTPVYEVTERKNLDAVISEIRLEEREALDIEVKQKLARLTDLSNEIEKGKTKNKDLQMQNRSLTKMLDECQNHELENKRLQAKVFTLNQKQHDAQAALFGANYFNAYSKVKEAQTILNKKEDGEN